jgi:diaminohydroxyphosphoribosylaminopyrimidine deaminase/5-amino-6-(5-phosphoribosylamino)uracil reductase
MENNYSLNIHELFMSRALELASKGRGKVSPNPMVGCVLVKNGEIIGEGYHKEFGGPHAELMAIRNSRMDPIDSVAYVNLEPCCITGKTPPCTSTLKENGISEVYIGMLDPNSEVNGKGVEELENTGILTHVGVLEDESSRLNQGFYKWTTQGLPFVIAKVAQTLDGYMGVNAGTSTWITGDISKTHTHVLRSKVDAVLIGRQTALIDNPSLTVREVPGKNPIRVILDTNRTLPLHLKVFNDKKAKNIVLCSESKFNKSKTHFCQHIPVKEQNKKLSPIHILKALAEEGITSLLIEGGQAVLSSFILKNLIDQIYIYTSPNKLEGAELKNPLELSEEWSVIEEDTLGEDTLKIVEKGVKCLQES